MINKNWVYIVITSIVAITLVWLSQVNKNGESKTQLPLEEKLAESNFVGLTDALEGVLWLSDNKDKGNLMLINKYATIYLKTSRDFNNLVGKNVIVSAKGALDDFILLNIEESLSKDGFIKVQ